MKLHHISAGIFAAIAVAAAFTSCQKKEKGMYDGVPEVSVAYPTVDSIVLSQSYPATLAATDVADIVGRVNGLILDQRYANGDYVQAGTPLFIIEPTTYNDAVNQAQASLENAQAQYDYASKQAVAMRKALEADAVSKMDVVQAESNVRQAEAAIKTAKAQLTTARTNLGYCTVTAPFSGRVSKSTMSPGAYVGGEAQPVVLATIYNDAKMFVNFSVSTDRYLEMTDTREGKQVDYNHIPVVFGDSIAGTYYGSIEYEAPGVNTGTGTVNMRLILKNDKGELKDGMFATVRLPYATNPKALLIKDKAISTDQLGKYVYVVNDSNQVVYTPIEVGELYNDSLRVVTKGLVPGQAYVTSALLKVRDGMKVKPVDPAAKADAKATAKQSK